jgi:hypothetical protein
VGFSLLAKGLREMVSEEVLLQGEEWLLMLVVWGWVALADVRLYDVVPVLSFAFL